MLHISKKKLLTAVVLLILLTGLWFWFGPRLVLSLIIKALPYGDNYYVVYLKDQQTFFGKILAINSELMRMSDVYYIQTSGSASGTVSSLIKRGSNEVSGPSGELFINRSHILYWERIGDDSQVMGIIKGKK